MTIAQEKKLLRTQVRTAERTISPEERIHSNAAITANVLALPQYQAAQCVFCFVGTPREIDTTGILLDILQQGKTLCVPLCIGDGIMELRQITSLDDLAPGAYGIMEPTAHCPAISPSQVELSIVPCVSCDRRGHRLGQGGGYYDRFFSSGTQHTILLCREVLMREPIPREAHDLSFPCVVTDESVFFNCQ